MAIQTRAIEWHFSMLLFIFKFSGLNVLENLSTFVHKQPEQVKGATHTHLKPVSCNRQTWWCTTVNHNYNKIFKSDQFCTPIPQASRSVGGCRERLWGNGKNWFLIGSSFAVHFNKTTNRLPQDSCSKNSITPQPLLPTTHWPRSLRTQGLRLKADWLLVALIWGIIGLCMHHA